jgi:hypothetical protein
MPFINENDIYLHILNSVTIKPQIKTLCNQVEHNQTNNEQYLNFFEENNCSEEDNMCDLYREEPLDADSYSQANLMLTMTDVINDASKKVKSAR